MKTFNNIPLSKYAEETDFLHKITQLLSQIVQKLQEKLLKKEIKCECENGEEICFDCLRFEAETLLADDFGLEDLDAENLETYSDLFEQELDKQVAELVKKYKENV